jgi:hypothetical protein
LISWVLKLIFQKAKVLREIEKIIGTQIFADTRGKKSPKKEWGLRPTPGLHGCRSGIS